MDVMIGFSAELWQWTGAAAWFFVTIPVDDAEDIREMVPDRRGFGSVRVEVEIGSSRWTHLDLPRLALRVLPAADQEGGPGG
jgi:hypothetical protein